MKLEILLFFLCFSIASADELVIKNSRGKSLVLESSECGKLLDYQERICLWKSQVDQDFDFENSMVNKCKKNKKGSFQINLSNCLPEFVKTYQKKRLYRAGPNWRYAQKLWIKA